MPDSKNKHNNAAMDDEPETPPSEQECDVVERGEEPPEPEQIAAQAERAESTPTAKPAKHKFSGAYWYLPADSETLVKRGFIRTVLLMSSFIIQLVVLLLEQGGLQYVTMVYPSYAYVYMWSVFLLIAVWIYVIIMNFTRYKLVKRIPVERAPKKGFKYITFWCNELFLVLSALIAAIELSFVCIYFDAVGLISFLLCAGALAAAICARQIAHRLLKDAIYVPAKTE